MGSPQVAEVAKVAGHGPCLSGKHTRNKSSKIARVAGRPLFRCAAVNAPGDALASLKCSGIGVTALSFRIGVADPPSQAVLPTDQGLNPSLAPPKTKGERDAKP